MAMFDGFSEEDFKKAIEANPEAWGKPLTSGLNNGSPEGNPGFSSVGGSGGGLVWTGEQPFTQADKDQFANWSNAQTGGDMTGDFETQTLQDHYKSEMERYGPGMKYSDSFMAVVNGTDSYLGQSYQKERGLDNRSPNGGLPEDKAVDLDFGVGMSTKKAQEQQTLQNAKTEANATVPVGESNLSPTPNKGMFDGMSQEQVAQAWQANPEGFKKGMLENPEAWGFSRYNTLDNGRLIGINAEGGGNRVLDLGYDEGGNVNTGGPKGEFNDSLGVSQRPDSAPAGSYLPSKPKDMSDQNIKNWHSYYRNNPELQEHLSLDERQDLKYLDYLTGNYEGGYKEYKEDSYALRKEHGLDRHYSVPGRDSHRFEYQYTAPKGYNKDDMYDTFRNTHEDIGGFYKQEGLPGGSLFQEAINNPLVEVAANILAPGYGTLALTAARAANGQTLKSGDYASLVASFAPTGGKFLSDVTKGAVSPTIGSGIIAGGAQGIAGGDLEDMVKAGVINIGANTIANTLKHQILGDGTPTSEVLNEIMPDEQAAQIGDWMDENVFNPLQEKLDLGAEWEMSNGDVYKIDDLQVKGNDLVSIETGDVVGKMSDVINEISYDLNLPDWVEGGIDALGEAIRPAVEARFGGGKGGNQGESPEVGGQVDKSESSDKQKEEEPEVVGPAEPPPEEVEEVEIGGDIVTENPLEPEVPGEVVIPGDIVDFPEDDAEVIADPTPEEPLVPGNSGPLPKFGESSGGQEVGGINDIDWSELFPYTKLTKAEKTRLLPHVNYIRSVKA